MFVLKRNVTGYSSPARDYEKITKSKGFFLQTEIPNKQTSLTTNKR